MLVAGCRHWWRPHGDRQRAKPCRLRHPERFLRRRTHQSLCGCWLLRQGTSCGNHLLLGASDLIPRVAWCARATASSSALQVDQTAPAQRVKSASELIQRDGGAAARFRHPTADTDKRILPWTAAVHHCPVVPLTAISRIGNRASSSAADGQHIDAHRHDVNSRHRCGTQYL